MVGFLGDNVGDHLRAASANVRGDGAPHFEQSVLADELSAESMAQVKDLITRQWQQLMRDMVPQLEALMAADQQAGRVRDQAVRIGMYSWMRDMTPEEQAHTAPSDGAKP
jgi:acid stress-induced BolA-like protein IbaG/YrbA